VDTVVSSRMSFYCIIWKKHFDSKENTPLYWRKRLTRWLVIRERFPTESLSGPVGASADKAWCLGGMLGWVCNCVCLAMGQVHSVYTADSTPG
jgi:hypothetical protein